MLLKILIGHFSNNPPTRGVHSQNARHTMSEEARQAFCEAQEQLREKQWNYMIRKLQTNLQKTIENCAHGCDIYTAELGETIFNEIATKGLDWSFLEK